MCKQCGQLYGIWQAPAKRLFFSCIPLAVILLPPDLQANVDMMLMRSYSAARQFKEAQHYYDIVLRNYDKKSPEDFHVFMRSMDRRFLSGPASTQKQPL